MRFSVLIFTLVFSSSFSFGQDELKRNMYYGNQAFIDGEYEKAAGYYLDAVDQAPLNFKANYNLSNAYYRMNQFDKAMERMNTVVHLAPTSFDKAKAYHNIGNAHMMKQDWDGAIEAYKNALRLNPSDEESRYNLAYALEMKKQQEQQDRQNGDGQGDGMSDSSDENEENADQNSDENNDNSDESQEENDTQSDQNNDQNQNNDGEGQSHSYEAKLSKEQIENIMEKYYQREKDLQKRLNRNKRVGYGSPRKKDW